MFAVDDVPRETDLDLGILKHALPARHARWDRGGTVPLYSALLQAIVLAQMRSLILTTTLLQRVL